VTSVRLSRIFWIGAAATLVAAALIGVAGLLRSDLTETDGKILLTLLALLVAGGTAVAGLALVDRGLYAWFGWLTAFVAAVGFAVIAAATWQDFDDNALTKSAGTAAIALVGVLLASTQLLLHRGRLTAVVVPTWIALFLAVWGTTVRIWAEVEDGGLWKAVGSCWILGVLGWLLVPVLQRYTSAGADATAVRVLAVLDDVDLVAGRGPVEGVTADSPESGDTKVVCSATDSSSNVAKAHFTITVKRS
jgi:hypothetical protein